MSTEVSKLFDYDVVLVPFFYDDPQRDNTSTFKSNDTSETPTPQDYENSGTVLVTIKTKTLQLDLFSKASRDSIQNEIDGAKSKYTAISICRYGHIRGDMGPT
jgi:hypothetical protein